MHRLIFIASLILIIVLCGCAAGPRPAQQAAEEEWPTGPGTIPPSWYDYNPALKHWFDPWYENPYRGGF